jgi:hypothetical protein
MPTKYQRFTSHHRARRHPSLRDLLVVWVIAGVLGASVAHARAQADESADENPAVSVIGSTGERTIAAGVRRMLPGMVKRLAARRARSSWRLELDEALVGRDEGILNYYSDEGTPVFTDADGFTPVGRRVFALLHEAPYHGLSHLQSSLREIRVLARAMKRAHPERDVATSAGTAELANAWSRTRGADDRLASTAAVLGTRDSGVAAANELETARAQHAAARQARLEVGLADALADMATHIVHRPWIGGTLRDDNKREISPDALWFADPTPIESEVLEALFAAAQEGDEALWEWFEARLPPGEQYMGLVGAARHYAALCSRGGWEDVRTPWAVRGRMWKASDHI